MSQVVQTGLGYTRILRTLWEVPYDELTRGLREDAGRIVLDAQIRYRILGRGRGREGSKEGNEMAIYRAPPMGCIFPICYVYKSPQQNSEAPLRCIHFVGEVSKDHRR